MWPRPALQPEAAVAIGGLWLWTGLQKDGNDGDVFPANQRFWQPLLASQLKQLQKQVSISLNELQEMKVTRQSVLKTLKKMHKNHSDRDNQFENCKYMAFFDNSGYCTWQPLLVSSQPILDFSGALAVEPMVDPYLGFNFRLWVSRFQNFTI